MSAANDLLNRAKNLDAEQFCTEAFVITSERKIIDPKVSLQVRYEFAYEVVRARLSKSHGVGAASLPEEPDYYDLLNLDENATQEEIEEAYKQKKASLQPEVLEQKLKAQGLSESEIQKRLEKSKTTLHYVEKSRTVLGNEERRDHYNEYLRYKRQSGWRGALDRKQRKAIDKKTLPINHGENWNALGVTPNPTQLELRTAYLVRVREHDPERYLQQIEKGVNELTLDELKEYNVKQEKWSDINRAYAEEVNEKQLKAERKEFKLRSAQSKSPEAQFNILIEINPTTIQTEASDKELWKQKDLYKTVSQAGTLEFTAEEIANLKSKGLVPDTASVAEVNQRAELALDLHSRGVKAVDFSQSLDNAKFLTPEQNKSFQFSAFIMESLEEENPERGNSLHIGNREPTVSINEVPSTYTTPQPNQLVLQNDGGNYLSSIFKQSLDLAKDKARKVVTKTLEKTGLGTAKTAAKQAVTKALNEGGKKLLTKIGSQIAIKAGLSTIAAVASGGTSLLAQAALWIGSKLLKPLWNFAKKTFSGILRFITGKDDLQSQLRTLSLYGLAASIAMGSMGFAIAAAGSFLLFSGVGSVGATIAGAFTAFITVITATVIAISTPVLISVFVFLFLIIFIITIINNSAFVVPMGGFGTGSSQMIPIGDFECTFEKGPVSFENNTSSNIASRAWEITADLYQGFWCYWNRSPNDSARLAELLGEFPPDDVIYPPSYRDYFDEEYFVQNPNPGRNEVENDASTMFWCTHLVIESYRNRSAILIDYNSQRLENWFREQNRFIEASNANSTNIPEGSVIFFYVYGGPDRTNHVAIAHHIISGDAIRYVQSNSGFKDGYLSFEDDGTGIINPTWARITGFGLP